MALPAILLPEGTPAFTREHEFELQPAFGDQPMQTGSARRRRVWRSPPRVASVALELNVAQMAAFDDWYEQTLQAGARDFSAPVANLGTGIMWWQARFVGGGQGSPPYNVELLDGAQQYKVTTKLLLLGEGSLTPPATSVLTGSVAFDLLGAASISAAVPLSGSVTFDLADAGYTATGVGSAAGTGSGNGVGLIYLTGVGSAAGVSTASAVSSLGGGSTASASGSSTVTGVGIGPSVGSASGTSTATGVSSSNTNILTTKGDIYTRSATADAREPIGSDWTTPLADSTKSNGWSWGPSQVRQIQVYVQTTGSTATALTSDGAAATSSNQAPVPAGPSVVKVSGHITAIKPSTGDVSGWEFSAVLKRTSGGTVSLVGTASVILAAQDSGASGWAVAILADDTNKCVKVQVTGVSSTTINWVAHLYWAQQT